MATPVELTGDPTALNYPVLCPNCGAEADERIRIEKVFVRSGSEHRQEVITSVVAPFCGACAAQHAREVVTMTPLQRLVSELSSELVLPVLFSGLTGLFFLKEALGAIARPVTAAVLGGVALGFLGIAWASYRASVDRTASRRVTPQTSVTLAFDFSDDRSAMFDEQRHLYTIKNDAFAIAFAAQNQVRAWNPASPKAIRAKGKRTVATYVVVGVAVIVVIWSVLHGS